LAGALRIKTGEGGFEIQPKRNYLVPDPFTALLSRLPGRPDDFVVAHREIAKDRVAEVIRCPQIAPPLPAEPEVSKDIKAAQTTGDRAMSELGKQSKILADLQSEILELQKQIKDLKRHKGR
jgi:hypothetical protein